MKRGEVRWYKFNQPDKQRPVLVLTRDSIIEYLGDITIAPVTTRIRNIPSEVVLTPEEGMPQLCAVNCDHLQTVQKSRLGAVVTSLTKSKMQEVSQALAFALDLHNC
ncbi:MAG: type II toxin-antitoxin system PemK/MazF family toxin [Desulfuromonadales bacterium]|nr:type II toxin-antitoxin system PemK/MazF family toxin [Desulfuromonadales bacterium]